MNRLTAIALRCTRTPPPPKRRRNRKRSRCGPTPAAQIERGKFLVTIGDCHGCHTPLTMGPGHEPDMSRGARVRSGDFAV